MTRFFILLRPKLRQIFLGRNLCLLSTVDLDQRWSLVSFDFFSVERSAHKSRIELTQVWRLLKATRAKFNSHSSTIRPGAIGV